jgi:hypothetical protein
MKLIKSVSKEILKPYVIAIPTYAREKIIFQRTLKTLYECSIKSDYTYLFFASDEEYKKYLDSFSYIEVYKKKIDNKKYMTWLSKVKCVIGILGLSNQRNFISKFFQEGQYIIQMDDDIQDFYFLKWNENDIKNRKQWDLKSFKLKNSQNPQNPQKAGFVKLTKKSNLNKDIKKDLKSKNKTLKQKNHLDKIKHPKTLHNLILDTFKYCLENGIYLWGIYPIENAYFMNPEPSTKLKFIVGPCFGIINRHRADLELTLDEKENVERTLQYWTMDGKVLRLNNITLRTQYYKVPGGMQSEGKDRKKEAMRSAEYLHSKYPEITKIYLGKKSGHPEIKLLN